MHFRSAFLAATALLTTANGHVFMKSPVPYSVDKLDNSPITKSQYPCKSQNGFTVSTMNAMKVGEKQTMALSGSAVHGGGSCQLSVSLDTEPTANSIFKVIKSMEGGCPGVESQALSYDFELPASIPNGKATFAWTWFSKLSGQPELYMNCAPIDVTGGASDKSAFNSLPDMLVANLDDTCKSVPNFAVQFPTPGDSVQKGATNDLKPPTGSGCGKTSGTTPAEPSSPGGVFAPAKPTAPSPAKPTAPSSPGTVTPSPPTSGGGASTTCTSNGAIVCNGTTQFGLCNNGNVVWQAVAAGTTCANGVISKRGYNGRIARRRYASRKVAVPAV
ncbi:lytic polysaccharide monooxygenase [Cucurbitaria berberidis CBS 394.84]|uniref:Lytic polysaccharide monooxygenase n=1 Tax=Cucurbitaria berberidis CBS 394.84 TaxID=1168544 RepID=A0A9P4L5I1_9PLEO|nr:lytic polysaccharide monooxygenase [Cucurbitaria berberidis CBS 394.84]KAF1842362.1 lytic polysaccharide monooxygenase [Cucurbitaria berberidis CBS 394.84]